MTAMPSRTRMRATARARRVPEPTVLFWITKGVSTAMGEAVSDFSIRVLPPVLAVLTGFVLFALVLCLQFSRKRYTPWAYWATVGMVGVFGTMAADVMHVVLGVPYLYSTLFYAAVLAAVFLLWHRVEHTLSVHDITSFRREAFYWAAVVATFAMGTALGDLAAVGFGLGYLTSVGVFALVILIPVVGFRFGRWNAVFSFWFAYVITRPLGASIADWLGKPRSSGGVGLGDGWVSLGFVLVMAVLVAVMAARTPRRGLVSALEA